MQTVEKYGTVQYVNENQIQEIRTLIKGWKCFDTSVVFLSVLRFHSSVSDFTLLSLDFLCHVRKVSTTYNTAFLTSKHNYKTCNNKLTLNITLTT
jgi:hypothetical protein